MGKKCELLLGGITLLYPFLIYYNRDTVGLSSLCLIFIATLSVIRAILFKGKDQLLISISILFIISALLFVSPTVAHLFYPVIVSISVALYFGFTLVFPPSAIEQIARLIQGNLDDKGIDYTRKVTFVWVIFCMVNAAISCMTILMNNEKWWFLYNGVISYGLMGLLFSGEYLYRKWVLKL